MKNRITALISAVLAVTVGMSLIGCAAGEPGRDGIDGIDGINGVDGVDGKDGMPGKDGASAYEQFVASHSDYTKSEAEWLNDLAAGKLADSYEYSVVSYGRNYSGTLTSGTATSDGSTLTLTEAVIKLNSDIVMPIAESAEWEINIGGVLATGDSGVEILASLDKSEEGRVYFGVHAGNAIAYLGARVGGYYFNYCWDVTASRLKSQHDYTIKYKDGVYTLSVDGGTANKFTKFNQNQSSNVTVNDAKLASSELNDKIRAATGQDYFEWTSIGADTHKVSAKLNYVNVKTSSIYTHETMSAHPLYGKMIYHLGSSISRGYTNGGISFADQISTLTGSKFQKEAVDGTPLVGPDSNSYVKRFDNNMAPNFRSDKPAFLVLQLSTNDFSQGKTIGSVTAEGVTEGFNTSTVCGAIEYIISETKRLSPDTKVMVYACEIKSTWNAANRQSYASFVNTNLKTIQNKWGILVLDLFNANMLNTSSWMSDDIHPSGYEYANHFTPAMINMMVDSLKG